MPATLPPWERAPVPIGLEAGWVPEVPRTMVVADRKISACAGIESFIHLIVTTEHSISCVCYEKAAIRK
jgi:hypothetical protein